jgi:ribonuclease P protein component
LPQAPRFFFRKENRVLRRADFVDAYSRGTSYRRRAAHVIILPREESALPTRLGVTATRKIGGAVQRNRLKRIAREVFRLALPRLKSGYTIIVNYHHGATAMDFGKIQSDLHSAWLEARIFQDDNGTIH